MEEIIRSKWTDREDVRNEGVTIAIIVRRIININAGEDLKRCWWMSLLFYIKPEYISFRWINFATDRTARNFVTGVSKFPPCSTLFAIVPPPRLSTIPPNSRQPESRHFTVGSGFQALFQPVHWSLTGIAFYTRPWSLTFFFFFSFFSIGNSRGCRWNRRDD